MSQSLCQQKNGNSDIEKQSGCPYDGVDCIKKIHDAKRVLMLRHAMSLLSCVIVVLCVDPLFLYLPVINQDNKFLKLDKRLMVTALCLRSVNDMIYVGIIILGYISGRHNNQESPQKIKKMSLGLYFAIDILALLPIPQVLVPIFVLKITRPLSLEIRNWLLNLFLLLQYVPRVLRIYLSWKVHIESSKFAGRVCKAAFNICLYILASHVIGALWYFLSIQRETDCWNIACKNHIGCTPNSFKCGRSFGNYTFIDDACPIQTPNTTLVDFGIFLEALQSGTVSSTNISQKIMHGFWWGLRNLSSYGQNLQTSTYFWENCFAVFISIYGLVMFLYFIGKVQIHMQMAIEKKEMDAKKADEIEKKIRCKMGQIISKIEFWMTRSQLPCDMKVRIINDIVRRLKENIDFDLENLISHLSEELTTEINNYLHFPSLKKLNMPNLESHGENLAEGICESHKPKYSTTKTTTFYGRENHL